MSKAITNIIGWIPLIVFWTMRANGIDTDWSISLPAFSVGVFISAIINQ